MTTPHSLHRGSIEIVRSGARVAGKVAFITGAARGQGRSHAIRLAGEGADIVAVDICADVVTAPYRLSSPADLDQTAKLVEAAGGRVLTAVADVRDQGQLDDAVAAGVAAFGRLDIVVANAGITSFAPSLEMGEEQWQTMLDVNLSGVWRTCKAGVAAMRRAGKGGSVIITSSICGLKGTPNVVHYTAAKHGIVGVMRTLAVELATEGIRVNTVHPTNVDTDMIQNEAMWSLFSGGAADEDLFREGCRQMNTMDVPWVDAADVSNAVLFLASDEARYITGVTLPVDAGCMLK